LIEGGVGDVEVTLLVGGCGAFKVELALWTYADLGVNVLGVARVRVRMVCEQVLVGLFRDTEWRLRLLRLVHLQVLAHVVFLRLPGHLPVVITLGWIWLIESVDNKLPRIVDGA